jgi:hypothetical protein
MTYHWYCNSIWSNTCPTTVFCPNPFNTTNSNWQQGNCSGPGAKPTLADDVTIAPEGMNNTVVVDGTQGSCRTLTTLMGTTLSIQGILLVNAGGTIGGSLTIGPSTIGGPGGQPQPTVTATGAILRAGGNLGGINYLILNSYGPISWESGEMLVGNSVWTSYGAMAIHGDARMLMTVGTPAFINMGTMTKSVGTGQSLFQGNFCNRGTFDVTSGIVRLDGGSSDGDFHLSPGCTLDINSQTLYGGATITGAGRAVASGTVTVNDTVTADNVDITGTLRGAGALTVNQSLHWSGTGTISQNLSTTIGPDAEFTIDGTGSKSFSSGSLTMTPGTTTHWNAGQITGSVQAWTNAAGATFFADAPALLSGGASPFNNQGRLRKTTAGTTELRLSFSNQGVVDVEAGRILFNNYGTATSTGTWNVYPGATLAFQALSGLHTFDTGTTFPILPGGNGVVSFETHQFEIRPSVQIANLDVISNATVRGTGNITVTNALNWVSGTIEGSVIPMPDLSIPASCTITTGASGNHTLSARRMDLAGTMIWTPTTAGFSLSNGAQVYNHGLWDHRGDGDIAEAAGGGSFYNATGGRILRSAGNATLGLPTLTNAGEIRVQTGQIDAVLHPFTQTTGSIILENNTTFFRGSQNLDLGQGFLEGQGLVNVGSQTLINDAATVRPGLGSTTGQLSISGRYRQGAGGTLQITLAPGGQSDRLICSNIATLQGGQVTIDEAGYTPVAGDEFVILTASSITGTFAAGCIQSPSNPRLRYGIRYTPTQAILFVACYANCDCSAAVPTLNVNDYTCFMNQFNSGSPYANCDGSTTPPMLNVADYICFMNMFSAGCS